MSQSNKKTKFQVRDFVQVMDQIAPLSLAQDWDNVGLLAGDPGCPIRRVLLCIDLTPPVAREAIRRRADVVMAYHPPLFKPIKRLRNDDGTPAAAVFECVRAGIAVYSTHTALDAADGGTNDVIANCCGATNTEPLIYAAKPGTELCKLVVFVPADSMNAVAEAMFALGAGQIGDYSHCSFGTEGSGTFWGHESTNPAVGKKGRLESVKEIRFECVAERTSLPCLIRDLKRAHPYEEPAFDVYPLLREPVRGIGRVAELPSPTTVVRLARKLKRAVSASTVQLVGNADAKINRVIIVVGAAGTLPFGAGLGKTDVIVTGEIRHHDALSILRCGAHAIALNHWTSERPTLAILAERLTDALPGVQCVVSKADLEPFRPV